MRLIGYATVTKYEACWTLEEIEAGDAVPFAVVRSGPNQLMYGGGSAFWESLMGTFGGAPFNASAAIGVGDSGAGDDRTINDLLGGQTKRKAMDGGTTYEYRLFKLSETVVSISTFYTR